MVQGLRFEVQSSRLGVQGLGFAILLRTSESPEATTISTSGAFINFEPRTLNLELFMPVTPPAAMAIAIPVATAIGGIDVAAKSFHGGIPQQTVHFAGQRLAGL
jgi:hypothetical protein